MNRQNIQPDALAKRVVAGHVLYSHVVTVEGRRTIFVSGQVPRDRHGNVVGKGDMRAQMRQVGENVKAGLEAAGATLRDVVKITTFIVGYKPEHRSLMHQVRSRYVSKENPPASTLLGVQALAIADYLIEVEAIAVAGRRASAGGRRAGQSGAGIGRARDGSRRGDRGGPELGPGQPPRARRRGRRTAEAA